MLLVFQLISLNEIATPTLIMIILGIMYTYITSAIPNGNKETPASSSTPTVSSAATQATTLTTNTSSADESPSNDFDKYVIQSIPCPVQSDHSRS